MFFFQEMITLEDKVNYINKCSNRLKEGEYFGRNFALAAGYAWRKCQENMLEGEENTSLLEMIEWLKFLEKEGARFNINSAIKLLKQGGAK